MDAESDKIYHIQLAFRGRGSMSPLPVASVAVVVDEGTRLRKDRVGYLWMRTQHARRSSG